MWMLSSLQPGPISRTTPDLIWGCATEHMGFPGGSVVENPPANAGDVSSIPGLERSLGGEIGKLLQYSCLENSMNKRNWATVHGVAESWTWLSDWAWRRKQNRLYLESKTPSWARLWTVRYMPRIYGNNTPTGKPGPRRKSPRALHLLKEYPNYLCNRIESYILLRLLGYAAAAAKSFQSCPILCNPIDGSPPHSPVPGIFQARTLEWVAISFSNARKWKVKVKSLSPVRLLATPWTAAYQAPPSMGFSRQEYWSGVPLPSLYWGMTTGLLIIVHC